MDKFLGEFATDMHHDVEGFARYYRSQHQQDPANWPEPMPAAEWHEQFMAWLGNKETE